MDPTNAVLPANRAMALLKMNRFAAAEQDCTVALTLDPTYTKALFRRATARVKLNKLNDATHDFNELLKQEPENKTAKTELTRISNMMTSEVTKNMEEQEHGLVFPIIRPSYMRSKKPLKTILIEEIGSETSLAVDKNLSAMAKSASSMVKVDAPSTTKELATTIKGSSAAALKGPSTVTMETSTTMTNMSGTTKDSSSTIKDTSIAVKDEANSIKENIPVTSKSSLLVKPKPQQLPAIPSSSVMFLHEWKRLRTCPDLQSDYFKLLPVDKYATTLSQCLETDVFPDIINILYNSYVKCGRSCIKELEALTKVQRFSVALMFLSSKEKSTLHWMFSELKSLITTEDEPLLQQLAKTYKASL